MQNVAWFRENSNGYLHAVGTKAPNALGLYDMSGNVWELCWDWYTDYGNAAVTDPCGPLFGNWRISRGGSYTVDCVPVSCRSNGAPFLRSHFEGFRVVRSAS